MLQLNLLGEQRLTEAGADVGAGKTRALELLAYLVLHPDRLVARLVVAGTFWPESTDAQALTNLRRELHNLRSLLGGPRGLRAAGGAIGWVPDAAVRIDVQDFVAGNDAARSAADRADAPAFLRHASSALASYRGELMPGSYADWVGPLRESLQGSCSALCTRATTAWLVAGQAERALEPAVQGIRVSPLSEKAYRDLIRVQLALGEHAAAMHSYHSCCQMLERELGVGPEKDTLALVADLPGERTDSPRAGRLEIPIGRAREMAGLHADWEGAAGGRNSVALLTGGPGIGKTHVAEHLAAWAAARGALVARARCFEGGESIALAPVAAWLQTSELSPVLRGLPARIQRDVRRLLPELGGNPPPQPPATADVTRAMVDAWQRFGYFESLARGISAAGRPTLLVLDDLQWCGSETAAWVSFLFAGAYAPRLMLVATMRTGSQHPSAAVRAMLASLQRLGLLHEIPVAPLDEADTGALAGTLDGGPVGAGRARMLRTATGGYPLFIIQAARIDAGGAPGEHQELGAVLVRRIATLGRAARVVANVVAANGRETGMQMLGAATDLASSDLVEAVDELWSLGILVPVGSGYYFAHRLLADVTYRLLTPAQRWLLHRRIAETLEEMHGGDPDAVAARLAEQHALASNPARALHFRMRAGAVAVGVFANATALDSYRQALAIVGAMDSGGVRDAAELDVRRAMSPPLTALHGYSCAELLDNLERSVVLAEGLGRPDVLAASLVGLFCGRYVQGRIGEAYDVGQRALELGVGDGALVAQGHFAVAGAALALGRPAEAIEHFASCYTVVTPGYSTVLGTRIEIHARAWAAHAHWLAGDRAGARRLATEALERSVAAAHPYTRAVALAYVALLHQLDSDAEGLQRVVKELTTLCRRYDIAYYGQWAEIFTGWSTGSDPGIRGIRAALRTLTSQDALVRMPYWHSLLADALARDHQRDAALAELHTALALAHERREICWVGQLDRQRELLGQMGERPANGRPPSVVVTTTNHDPPGSTS